MRSKLGIRLSCTKACEADQRPGLGDSHEQVEIADYRVWPHHLVVLVREDMAVPHVIAGLVEGRHNRAALGSANKNPELDLGSGPQRWNDLRVSADASRRSASNRSDYRRCQARLLQSHEQLDLRQNGWVRNWQDMPQVLELSPAPITVPFEHFVAKLFHRRLLGK